MRRFTQNHKPHVGPRARAITAQASRRANRAKYELVLLVPLFAATVFAYVRREELFGVDTPVRIIAAIALLSLGWAVARDLGRFLMPSVMRRMDPGTAGTVGFLIRLAFLVVAALVALRVAGLQPGTLAVGASLTALVVGLAAQQTLGNLIAGLVLIAVRPFKVGDRVQFQGGATGGQIEGKVDSLGLLYTTLTRATDQLMVPNNVVLGASIVPLREPDAVDLKARLNPDIRPSDVQALIEESITTPTRGAPKIALEEIDAEEVVFRIKATPMAHADGPKLADEVLAAIAAVTQQEPDARQAAGSGAATSA